LHQPHQTYDFGSSIFAFTGSSENLAPKTLVQLLARFRQNCHKSKTYDGGSQQACSHCHTLPHNATRYNTLQHAATHETYRIDQRQIKTLHTHTINAYKCVPLHIFTHVYTRTHTHAHIHTHTITRRVDCAEKHTYTHTHNTRTHAHVHMYTHANAHMHAFANAHAHSHLQAHAEHTHTQHTHKRTRTHTHT